MVGGMEVEHGCMQQLYSMHGGHAHEMHSHLVFDAVAVCIDLPGKSLSVWVAGHQRMETVELLLNVIILWRGEVGSLSHRPTGVPPRTCWPRRKHHLARYICLDQIERVLRRCH